LSSGTIDTIKKLHAEKNWQEIISFCKKMLDEDQKDLVALQNLSTALVNSGKFEEAITFCDEVLQINKSDEYALKNKIFALAGLRRFDDVISSCDVFLQKNDGDILVLDSKGVALSELGRHDEAISNYDKSLQINPNNEVALMNMAITLSFLQKYEEAIQFYDRAQKSDSSIKEAALAKSDAYKKLGCENEAFLAAQGLLVEDIDKLVLEARQKKMKVFDLFCLKEFEGLEEREKKHNEKQDAKAK
jgi:tetratricopeptide (TPR) repeat protein